MQLFDTSRYRNVTMIGLLITDQISKMSKRIESKATNPVVITNDQEQFLLSLHHWVVHKHYLQEPINSNDVTLITVLNQTQLMCA